MWVPAHGVTPSLAREQLSCTLPSTSWLPRSTAQPRRMPPLPSARLSAGGALSPETYRCSVEGLAEQRAGDEERERRALPCAVDAAHGHGGSRGRGGSETAGDPRTRRRRRQRRTLAALVRAASPPRAAVRLRRRVAEPVPRRSGGRTSLLNVIDDVRDSKTHRFSQSILPQLPHRTRWRTRQRW